MAAGEGFKTFSTGDILTAADVNGYLMQGVWVFANAAERTSEVTSPQEGNVSFLKDTNSLEIYDGSSWVAYGAGDITGITAGIGISGGGTSGTVTITNSMATAIDAKGDLVVGTGADTFDKLTVGTNEHRLVADSGQTTGLKYVADTTNYAIAAKGDLLVGTAADTVTNVAVGTNGHVLTADSSTASGVKWAAAGTSGMTLIASGTIGSSGTAITSIPGTYRDLVLYINNYDPSDDNTFLAFQFNGDGTANRHWTVASNTDGVATATTFGSTTIRITANTDNTTVQNLSVVRIPDYANTVTWKFLIADSLTNNATTTTSFNYTRVMGVYNQTSAITQVNLGASQGSINGGTYALYGVN